ncbi:MAG: hypothetical protein IT336_15915, partial [Thermomicrobiales bacterium]|nr:hypothetical protein [Thermomicrobiales bacterium]
MIGRHLSKTLLVATAIVATIGGSTLSMRGADAQNATPTPAGAVSTVSVNGTGSVTVTPDAASISVGVNVVNAN